MRTRAIAVALAVLFSTSACLVEMSRCRDPRPVFAREKREAARHQKGRGRAHEVNVLVWEPDEQQLIRASIPLWMVRKLAKKELEEREAAQIRPARHDADAVEGLVRRHVTLKDLETASRGLLVEVEEDDGSQVLVWLR
jgi:hypothetical protein